MTIKQRKMMKALRAQSPNQYRVKGEQVQFRYAGTATWLFFCWITQLYESTDGTIHI